MNCSDEAHDHGHDHDHDEDGHGHGGHNHSHDIPLNAGPLDSLYSQIDIPHVSSMNAIGGPDSGQKVIKSWAERNDETRFCESEADDSLIIKIPFISSVSIRSITIKAGPSGYTPSAFHFFVNAPSLDFSDCESGAPTQIIQTVPSQDGVEYQVKATKFASLTSLTIFIPSNLANADDNGDHHGEETTRIYYIGFKGKWTAIPPPPGAIVYEAAARPSDHNMGKVTQGQAWGSGY